eukprot:TRINITY_DN4395_c0_g1_i3.p1 TRINITY_DN4395_c0_g1~~TRINITY_DN4395_c0_g1_i3.p1  ORF type:complete len:390 (-),score=98.33 TRINITY_DN4395_c0_g1_i3:41-1066(-)
MGPGEGSKAPHYARLVLLAGSLLGFFLLYGALQERIMIQPFGNGEMFADSAFLVLSNRVLAVLCALVLIWRAKESYQPVVPLHHYAYISLSNTLSTFCQYEALRYISFPTQTLGKCGKIVPVMIIGTFISGKKYGWQDYAKALLVSGGCALFLLSGSTEAPSKKKGRETSGERTMEEEWFGLCLILGYLFVDGFTSVFQERLFKKSNMSTNNQMLYVNMWSGLLSIFFLMIKGQLISSVSFSVRNFDFFVTSTALSLCSTFGQISILLVIKEFGALVFSIIMTTRQLFSILFSCFYFLHKLALGQWIGTAIVFSVLYAELKKPRHGGGHGGGGGGLSLIHI